MDNQYCEAKTMFEIDTLVFTWKRDSCLMKEYDYVASVGLLCEALNKSRPSKLMINYSKFDFELTPQLIAWTNETLFKRMRTLGVGMVSITKAESKSIQKCLTHLFFEESTQDVKVEVFGDLQKSMEWICKKKAPRQMRAGKGLFA